MSAKSRLNVVLLWHMHQPLYRDMRSSKYLLPWTYLHVIKDYVDMVAHLEAIPEARAVVNFTPTLLEQIDDYAQQIVHYFQTGAELHDPLLDALIQPVLPNSRQARIALLRQCLRANEERLINRYPHYKHLAEMARWLLQHPESIVYATDQYLIDLLVWFHLAWLGETVRRTDPRVQALLTKAAGFDLHDRNQLLRVVGELIRQVIERYRRLAVLGQIELAVTPYAHPIMPLLLDLKSTHEALPEAELPPLEKYPDGEERVNWHIQKGIAVFKHYFGMQPAGCWPSEGSLSQATLRLLQQHGFKWTASGETVLHNSIRKDNQAETAACLHRAYQCAQIPIACFFRDDKLSDQIGFTYSTWHADDAVANLLHHLENIASACDYNENSVVSIIMDGENAWEFYPENGYYFLQALYKGLANHSALRLSTYSDYLAQHSQRRSLQQLVAGSWVYGTFSTWIGSKDKNRGWVMLADAKKAYDQQLASKTFSEEMVERLKTQLAICEGSDWFWWFGDYNPSESVSDFDYLYRMQLSSLYILLGIEPPSYLSQAFSQGGGHPSMGGVMRRGQE
ncbi:MAG: glycoside hydrolase [Gammaproteobacteria bacterium]|nr:glycoside hydrolase [Gammaproteobacteria bacterium]